MLIFILLLALGASVTAQQTDAQDTMVIAMEYVRILEVSHTSIDMNKYLSPFPAKIDKEIQPYFNQFTFNQSIQKTLNPDRFRLSTCIYCPCNKRPFLSRLD